MIWSILIGLIIGACAKLLMPTRDPGGIFETMLLGIAGAIVASWIGDEFNIYLPDEPRGFLAAILGSFILLLVYRLLLRRGTPA